MEHNPEYFFSDLSRFVEQIDDVDYINLLLTSVGCVAQFRVSSGLIADPSIVKEEHDGQRDDRSGVRQYQGRTGE